MTILRPNPNANVTPGFPGPISRPSPPFGFRLVGEDDEGTRVRWYPAVDQYEVRIREDGEEYDGTVFTTSAYHTFPDLEVGQKYFFQVRAMSDLSGTSEWSVEMELEPTLITLPPDCQPPNLTGGKVFTESGTYDWPHDDMGTAMLVLRGGQGGQGGHGGASGTGYVKYEGYHGLTTTYGSSGAAGKRGATGSPTTVAIGERSYEGAGGRYGDGGAGGRSNAGSNSGGTHVLGHPGDFGRVATPEFHVVHDLSKGDTFTITIGAAGAGGEGGKGGNSAATNSRVTSFVLADPEGEHGSAGPAGEQGARNGTVQVIPLV
ncbi:MAG: fibronectin type III domain-containing protein [Acidobacteriota bacterium]|nr:fibronectin type III domain-containing protein [Acidobacteriota bacterium]